MTGGKDKGLHKTQPIRIQSPSHDFASVALAEITKGFRVDDLFLKSVCLDDSAPQQPTINPLLNLCCPNMQRFRQRVFREPVLTHASAGP